METKKRRQYTAEFKREAVRSAMSPGQSIVGTAKDLGMATSVLHRWRRDLARAPVAGVGWTRSNPRCSTDGAAPRVGTGAGRIGRRVW
ncbi:MAG: transposase [Gammaproteobacteria bacterium]|nr:transposase [Gammaproteobacteria bacterium]